jgi:hypothetical protein
MVGCSRLHSTRFIYIYNRVTWLAVAYMYTVDESLFNQFEVFRIVRRKSIYVSMPHELLGLYTFKRAHTFCADLLQYIVCFIRNSI